MYLSPAACAFRELAVLLVGLLPVENAAYMTSSRSGYLQRQDDDICVVLLLVVMCVIWLCLSLTGVQSGVFFFFKPLNVRICLEALFVGIVDICLPFDLLRE